MNFKYKLTKLTDDVFNGNHPNYIDTGHTCYGDNITELKVGSRFLINGIMDYLCTSTVTEILEESESEITFKTENSTYKLEIQ